MSSNDNLDLTPHGFADIIQNLHEKVVQAQPKDLYQFCADYFQHKLQEQRAELLSLTMQTSGWQQVSQSLHMTEFAEESSDQLNVPTEIDRVLDESDEEAFVSGQESFGSTTFHHTVHSDMEDELEDELGSLPPMPPVRDRGRRTSVSAESMAPTGDADYEKIVIEKTPEQRQRIESSIAKNFLFSNLDEEQYRDVVNAMSEKKVQNGEVIIQQGGIGDYFYVVDSGSFDCFVSKNGGEPQKVTDYIPGGSFGELALMYNAPRAATIVATSDSVLWALDRVTFRRMLMERTNSKRRMFESFLEEVPLLVSLEPYERYKIADALEPLNFEDGEVVIRQGDVGENFFIIESGEAKVTKDDSDDVFPTLKKGDYFGELALLNDKPRAATITAHGRLKVVTLGKKAFVRLLGPVVEIIRRNTANYKVISRHVE
ncbi:camp-dependent protein kinase regulatory subunit [Basidiobolus meristosporus CBS 931.73]|uniref:cAMP-dependent protein kinase regulatory subunit n=1 Tax=Basidiobolus meristosporus CBS 931.73 TaxID=1314790 RepID=A0A1Y1ZAA9_9FUNG|nr:camp-dependent protein kinase regulatory subunit [Basidiobolus meristosporus CBS 931.73]|eukprot:ORY07201.1 camp-dependent protein kinase regulatory subunit [Basidiobolus meristosporus CBS 931.73]